MTSPEGAGERLLLLLLVGWPRVGEAEALDVTSSARFAFFSLEHTPGVRRQSTVHRL